jgi:hypothetical protein
VSMTNPSDPIPAGRGITLFDKTFWSANRHELIASVAERLLTNKAKERVGDIYAAIESTLSQEASWADATKRMKADGSHDPETEAFLKDDRNRGRSVWHYVDLPIGADLYDPQRYPEFTNDQDVVHMLVESIRVLQGQSDRFSLTNALRLVTHLVGDVHQPVHVGCSFIDKSGDVPSIVIDPAAIREKELASDVGGNALILPIAGHVNLHAYWDSKVGEGIDLSAANDPRQVGLAAVRGEHVHTVLAAIQKDERSFAFSAVDDHRNVQTWPSEWASQSLAAAKIAYRSINITGKNGSRAYDVSWDSRDAYDARCLAIVRERMHSAAANLAKLLNTVLN